MTCDNISEIPMLIMHHHRQADPFNEEYRRCNVTVEYQTE